MGHGESRKACSVARGVKQRGLMHRKEKRGGGDYCVRSEVAKRWQDDDDDPLARETTRAGENITFPYDDDKNDERGVPHPERNGGSQTRTQTVAGKGGQNTQSKRPAGSNSVLFLLSPPFPCPSCGTSTSRHVTPGRKGGIGTRPTRGGRSDQRGGRGGFQRGAKRG